jgi:murein tripeptide amidase MpaA
LGGEQGRIAEDDRDGHASANKRHRENSQDQSLCELARIGRTWHGFTLLQRWTNEQVH